jgi:hypothetical protein
MAGARFTARPVGVDGVLRRFLVAATRLPHDTTDAQQELGKAAEVVFGAYVPVKTGRELRGIGSDLAGGVVTVSDYARNPTSGFDYVAVTRFGHRVDRIYPTHRSSAASIVATKRRRGGETLTHGFDSFASNAALRFTIGGRVLFRHSVRGYHPASDWAEDALPEIEAQAQVVATRLGHTLEARF